MKILKYLIGLVTAIGGVLALFGGSKNKKVKQLNKKVNQSKKVVKNKKKEIKKVNDILTDKKKKAGKLKNKSCFVQSSLFPLFSFITLLSPSITSFSVYLSKQSNKDTLFFFGIGKFK